MRWRGKVQRSLNGNNLKESTPSGGRALAKAASFGKKKSNRKLTEMKIEEYLRPTYFP